MSHWEQIEKKILDWPTAKARTSAWKESGQKIVFTNGCFDLIHYGHLHYLAAARDLGDQLIVGLNSDASVKRLKGASRPVKDQESRLHLLATLEFVSGVVLFEEDTPFQLIQLLEPNILVKGGDWKPEDIVGSDLVLANGGLVKSLPFIPGHSTTKYVKKIKN